MFDPKALADPVRIASTVSDLRAPAFECIRRNENCSPVAQVRALFLAAAVVADAIGQNPHELIAQSQRMMAQAEGPHTIHVKAIRDYAVNELLRRP